jgi:Raf kinase inhibitor-like YbhB/YbcL family protein
MGNGVDQLINVASTFGSTATVTTVWKWDVSTASWQFYNPSMDSTTLQSYAASKGYGVLTTINPGEGFWVNAAQAFSATWTSGTAINGTNFAPDRPYALKPGWNLAGIGNALSASGFNAALSATPPAAGAIPQNLTTLWAWDNPRSSWYFYAPNLEVQGGTMLTDYITNKGYLDFNANSKLLTQGLGFWVNSATAPVAEVFSVASSSYLNNGVISTKYAGAGLGSNISPQLSIANLPANTAKLAIVMDDEVTPCGAGLNACIHWGVFNLPTSKNAITEGENLLLLSGVVYGRAYDGTVGYSGPNLPSLSPFHTYNLTVYALSSSAADVASGVAYTRAKFESDFQSSILGKTTHTGKFPAGK